MSLSALVGVPRIQVGTVSSFWIQRTPKIVFQIVKNSKELGKILIFEGFGPPGELPSRSIPLYFTMQSQLVS